MAGKRGQGEGTIRKRKDGRWEAMYTRHLPNGESKRESLYAKTQKEAREKLTAMQALLDQGEQPITDRQTVADYLMRWLEDAARPKVKPKTLASYKQVTRLYLIPHLGRHQLAKLQPPQVQAMLNAMLAQGLSPRTAQYARAVLRKALNQALKWGLVTKNAAALVDPPQSTAHEITPLTPVQARRLLDTAGGDRLEALYSVALSLGLRQGEILGLRWEDVDFDAGTVSVRKQLQRLDGQPQLVDLKTRQSRRTIALPRSLVAQLKEHRIRQLAEQLVCPCWHDWSLVFPSTVGTPLEPRNLTRHFKQLLGRAGLPSIRFHDLRHSCASLLIAQGIPARVVMETLGHSQITLTMNTYAHIYAEVQRQAADAMERLFGVAD